MITLTLRTKRVFRAVGRSGLPEGQTLRLVLTGHTKDGGPRVGIRVGEPKATDRPVMHEGAPVAWVSAGVMKSHEGCVLDLEEEWPEGVGVATGLPDARREPRSYRHRPLSAP